MTISNTPRKAGPYAGNGSATTFAFAFKVFSAADVLVVRADTATGIEATLTLTTDYTVSLNADQDTSPGGTITTTTAPATGQTITLSSDMAYTQPVELTNNGGFYPRVINDALDRLTIGQQQLAEQVGRSIKTYISEAKTPEELRDELFSIEGAAASSAASAAASAEIAALSAQQVASVIGFGAVGDGVNDDTAAIQAAVNSGAKNILFPPGAYLVSSPILIQTSGMVIRGTGGINDTVIKTTADIDVFRVDIGGSYKYFNQFRDLAFEYTGAGSQASGSAIRYYDSTGTQTGGGTHGVFKNLTIRGFYHGIVFDKAKLVLWGSYTQIADYGQMLFDGVRIPYSAKTQAFGILFKGGPGAHNTFTNLFMQNTTACIRLGDGTTDGGLGDQVFTSCHLLDAQYAIDLIGPTGAGRYNQNVVIVGNQFDGNTVNTVRLSDMSNFRIGPNNSTASVGIGMTNCSNYFVEDRNTFSFPASVFLGNITTTSAVIVDASGTRYAQYMAARRNTNTSFIKFVGGNIDGAGAAIELYGGAHATIPNHALILGNRTLLRDQSGVTTYLDVDHSNSTIGIGNGAWNGQRMKLGSYQLWVDGSGRLRIKSGAPASDTDGTVVGTQV